jgi:hypothetical protein
MLFLGGVGSPLQVEIGEHAQQGGVRVHPVPAAAIEQILETSWRLDHETAPLLQHLSFEIA